MLKNETKLQSNEIESGIKQWNLNTYMVFLGWSHFSLCIKTPLEKGKLGDDINKMVKGIGNVNYDQSMQRSSLCTEHHLCHQSYVNLLNRRLVEYHLRSSNLLSPQYIFYL